MANLEYITSAVVVQTHQPKVMCGPPLGPDSEELIVKGRGACRRGRMKNSISSVLSVFRLVAFADNKNTY